MSTLFSANVTDVKLVLKERTHMHLCLNMLIFMHNLGNWLITYQPSRMRCPTHILGVKSLQAIVCTDTDRQQVQPRESIQNLMLFDGEPSINMPRRKSAFDPAVTLTSDLLASIYNQFIFVLNCTEVVNFMKFPQAEYKITNKLLACDDVRMKSPQTECLLQLIGCRGIHLTLK